MKTMFKLTSENIRLRYLAEQINDPFVRNFRDMAKKLKISAQTFWYWHTSDPKYQRQPSRKKCRFCGKSEADFILSWINDGTLSHLIETGKVNKGVKNGTDKT